MARLLYLSPDLSGNAVYPPWQFAQAMAEGGHTTALAGPGSDGPWPPLRSELAGAVVLPGRWAGLPRARAAVGLARKLGADVVCPFKAIPTSFGVARRVRHTLGIPLVLHLDDWDAGFFEGVGRLRRIWRGMKAVSDPHGDLWLRYMESRVRNADALTVSTRALQRRFGGTLVRQGLDVDRYCPEAYPRGEARARLGIDPDAPMVLFLGTPRLHKGLGQLTAPAGRPGALWFVGASAADLTDSGVPRALVEGAHVRGAVPFGEAAWYLAACDVFVVPQRPTPYAEHQLPAKLVQAMALGCAIVATDVGDAGELLGGVSAAGVVVPADDPEAVPSAVAGLLDDPEAASRMGAEARRRAESDLGWKSMRQGVESVLAKVGIHG